MSDACVAYIHHRFPSLTATFAYREVLAVREEGVCIVNIACRKPAADEMHAEARGLVEETMYLPPLRSPRLYLEALRETLCAPALSWRTAMAVLRAPSPREVPHKGLRSLAEFVRGACIAGRLRRMTNARHIHAPFSTETATMAWVASRLTGLPFSFTSHTACDGRMMRRKVADARFAVSISEFDRNRLMSEGTDGEIHVIHCGVTPEVSIAREPDGKTPLIASVGSLIEKKGHGDLIRACELLGKRGVPFRCEIAGGGPLQVPLKEEITKRGLDGIVTLLGVCDQERVGGMLALASVFALASVITADGDLDGIPVSLMEAMAAGVPCVSTRVSGIPELIESPREGLLVAPGNPEELADAIEKLLKDADLRTRIGAAAREKVAREFNLEASARRLAELFRSSLGSGPAGVRP